jgi:hypothetical protein
MTITAHTKISLEISDIVKALNKELLNELSSELVTEKSSDDILFFIEKLLLEATLDFNDDDKWSFQQKEFINKIKTTFLLLKDKDI